MTKPVMLEELETAMQQALVKYEKGLKANVQG
jgi:hypothetical protein